LIKIGFECSGIFFLKKTIFLRKKSHLQLFMLHASVMVKNEPPLSDEKTEDTLTIWRDTMRIIDARLRPPTPTFFTACDYVGLSSVFTPFCQLRQNGLGLKIVGNLRKRGYLAMRQEWMKPG
jgi:hypothetical protein